MFSDGRCGARELDGGGGLFTKRWRQMSNDGHCGARDLDGGGGMCSTMQLLLFCDSLSRDRTSDGNSSSWWLCENGLEDEAIHG